MVAVQLAEVWIDSGDVLLLCVMSLAAFAGLWALHQRATRIDEQLSRQQSDHERELGSVLGRIERLENAAFHRNRDNPAEAIDSAGEDSLPGRKSPPNLQIP